MNKQPKYKSSFHQFVVEDVSKKLNIPIEVINGYFYIYFKTIKHYIRNRYKEILNYNKKYPNKNRGVYEKLMLGNVFQITPSVNEINSSYASINKLSKEEMENHKYMSDNDYIEFITQLYESRKRS